MTNDRIRQARENLARSLTLEVLVRTGRVSREYVTRIYQKICLKLRSDDGIRELQRISKEIEQGFFDK